MHTWTSCLQCVWVVDLFLLSSEIKSLGIISKYSGPILQSLSCFNLSKPWGARLPAYLPCRVWEQMRRSFRWLVFSMQPKSSVECLSMCSKKGMYVFSVSISKMQKSPMSVCSRISVLLVYAAFWN